MLKRFAAASSALLLGLTAIAPVQALAADRYWQCVPYAREISGINIRGDAWTWWSQAEGRFETGARPRIGSVLVFRPHGRMTRGHVAVVAEVLTDKVIRVTHANWGGSRGQIEENVVIVDASDAGDWSQVRVWHEPSDGLGITVYPVYGFIHGERNEALVVNAAL